MQKIPHIKRCLYETNNKRDFHNHINRKIPCNPNRLHNSIKKEKPIFCKICNKDFASEYSLLRHNKTYHIEINGDNNKQLINGNNNEQNNNNIEGNSNKQINTEINGNKNNNIQYDIQYDIQNQYNGPQINNSIIIQPIINIHPYEYNDINDLTLFEQYLSLTSRESPHSALLDNLNLDPNKSSYHNIHVGNPDKNIMKVHNGNKWIKEIMKIALGNIIDSKTVLIKMIFNKFRFFLNNKALYYIPRYYHYYGFRQHTQTYKNLMNYIKVYIHNNQNMDKKIDKNIPIDRNDKIFWALCKKFDWSEVEELITKMEELNIDFNDDLDKIKKQIISVQDKYKLKNFFKKFLKRIDYLIEDYKNNENSDSSYDENNSSSDSSFETSSKDSKNNDYSDSDTKNNDYSDSDSKNNDY